MTDEARVAKELGAIKERLRENQAMLRLLLWSKQVCICAGRRSRDCRRHSTAAFRRYLAEEGLAVRK